MNALLEGKSRRHGVCCTRAGGSLVLHAKTMGAKVYMGRQLSAQFRLLWRIDRVARIRCVAGQSILSSWHGCEIVTGCCARGKMLVVSGVLAAVQTSIP